jgi:hypothetical protein
MTDCFVCGERLRNSENLKEILPSMSDFDIICSFCTSFLRENNADGGETLGRKLRALLMYVENEDNVQYPKKHEDPNVFVDGNVIDASKLFKEEE